MASGRVILCDFTEQDRAAFIGYRTLRTSCSVDGAGSFAVESVDLPVAETLGVIGQRTNP